MFSLRLDRPTSIDNEPRPDDGGHQRFPGIGLLVSENNYEVPPRSKRSVTVLKDTIHSVFISCFGLRPIPFMSAFVVNQFAIIRYIIPFWSQVIDESGIDFRC